MSGFEERDCIVATQPLISLKRYGHKNADSVARVKIFSSFKISGVCRVFDSVQVKSPCREQKRDCIFEMHPFVVKQTAHFLLIKKKKHLAAIINDDQETEMEVFPQISSGYIRKLDVSAQVSRLADGFPDFSATKSTSAGLQMNFSPLDFWLF